MICRLCLSSPQTRCLSVSTQPPRIAKTHCISLSFCTDAPSRGLCVNKSILVTKHRGLESYGISFSLGTLSREGFVFQINFLFFFPVSCAGRALNPHPHTRFFRGFFAVQKFFDYTISLRKSENPMLYSKGTSDSFWTHM